MTIDNPIGYISTEGPSVEEFVGARLDALVFGVRPTSLTFQIYDVSALNLPLTVSVEITRLHSESKSGTYRLGLNVTFVSEDVDAEQAKMTLTYSTSSKIGLWRSVA